LTEQTRAITLRGLRIVWRVLLLAVVSSVWITERYHSTDKQISQKVYGAICLLSIWLIVTIFRMRKRSAKRLAGSSHVADSTTLRKAYAIQLMLMACSFATVQYGVLVRFMGATLRQTMPFYIVGSLLLLYFKPTEIRISASEM